MWTDWKIDVAMVESMGDPLLNVMHSMGTDSVTGWNTVCFTNILMRGGCFLVLGRRLALLLGNQRSMSI